MSAYIGLGMTQGAKDVQKYAQGKSMREAQQAQAMREAKLSEMKLSEFENNAPLREKEAEVKLAQLEGQLRQTNMQNLKAVTFSHFDRFEADGDVKHLNNMLRDVKKNPIGANANSDIVRYDALDNSPEVRQMMIGAGYSDFDGILNDPKLKKSFVVTTNTAGQKQVWDVDKVYAATGYGKHMTNENLEETRKRAEISELLRRGNSLTSIQAKESVVKSMMEAEGIPRHEAWKRVTEIEKGSNTGQDMTAIKLISEEEGIGILEATEKYYSLKNQGRGQTDQERFVQDYIVNNPEATRQQASTAYANRNTTTQIKNQDAVEESKNALDEIGFLDMDLSNLSAQESANIQRQVSKIETLLSAPLSAEDKRVMRSLNNLTNLGATAGTKLTPQETGLMDSTLNNFKKYMFNEVGGSEATAAYETFRNIFRNSLYGATLTNAEIKAFNTAAGTLGQKFKPAMTRLNTQMQSIKNQLESIRDTNDPYIAKFYLGKDIAAIDDAIMAIDARIELTADIVRADGTTVESSLNVEEAKKINNRRPIDDIFGDVL